MTSLSHSRMTDIDSKMSPISKYFYANFVVNEENVKKFRETYRRLSKVVSFDKHEIDEQALHDAAEELNLQYHSDSDKDLLKECVNSDNEEISFVNVSVFCQGDLKEFEPNFACITNSSVQHPTSKSNGKPTDGPSTILNEILCAITIKSPHKAVYDFLNNYLLRDVKEVDKNR